MSIHIQSFDRLFSLFGSATLHNGKDMLFYPKIKKRKHKKLSRKFGLTNGERIFFARNLNVRSKFKKGLLVSDSGLHVRFGKDRPVINVPWSDVLNFSYDPSGKAIYVSYIFNGNVQSLDVPMKYFVKKKKYYQAAADHIFMPMMETLAYATRARQSGMPDNQILSNVLTIPHDVPVKRMKATNWWLIIFSVIAAVVTAILLSQNKSSSKGKSRGASSLTGLSAMGAGGSRLLSGQRSAAASAPGAQSPQMMRTPQYRALPDGRCEVTDVLGYKHVYLNFEMASRLTNFFTGFPITISPSSPGMSSSPESNMDGQTRYLNERLNKIKAITADRDEAVRKYRDARSRNDHREMNRWAEVAHNAQGRLNAAMPEATYSIDRDVKGIDF